MQIHPASASGPFSLTATATGPYAGVVVYQSRQNTRALSLSGNASAGIGGVIYAANALLTMSGNAQLQGPLVVGTLNLSGNAGLTQMAAGSDGTGDLIGTGASLLAGDLSVYINDPAGYLSADELVRIQDTINGLNPLLAPYNGTITLVSDSMLANLVLDAGTTSACGSPADGVLGCYDGPNREITLLVGWDWYAGADPTQIGANQYDFQTTVTHEFGHALGLGGSTDPNSPMTETLATGTVRRTMSLADLNLADPPPGADALWASPHAVGAVNVSGLGAPAAGPTASIRLVGSAIDVAASMPVGSVVARPVVGPGEGFWRAGTSSTAAVPASLLFAPLPNSHGGGAAVAQVSEVA